MIVRFVVVGHVGHGGAGDRLGLAVEVAAGDGGRTVGVSGGGSECRGIRDGSGHRAVCGGIGLAGRFRVRGGQAIQAAGSGAEE